MKLNDMLYNLLDLAKQENEPNRYTHSEEYNKLFDEMDRKTMVIDELEKDFGCPLEAICWLLQDRPILVLNPIDNSLQEIEHPLNFYVSTRQAFDIRHRLFKTTYEKGIWNTGGVIVYLKDYKKTWWLREDRSD